MKTILSLTLILSIASLFSCSKEGGKGRVQINLTDAPGHYDQVNVDIARVEVHSVPDYDKAEWIELPTNTGIYDLIQLTNGIDTTIVDPVELKEGKITQMRLILGTNNTVMEDSVVYPLTVASGSQTGIKLVGNVEIPKDGEINVLIDFDAKASVSRNGNGDFFLKPVIKVIK